MSKSTKYFQPTEPNKSLLDPLQLPLVRSIKWKTSVSFHVKRETSKSF